MLGLLLKKMLRFLCESISKSYKQFLSKTIEFFNSPKIIEKK